MTTSHPYDKEFLTSNIKLHELLFHNFAKNKEYDFFSLVDAYMRTSQIRAKMDVGNLVALNTGDKGLLSSIDYAKCFCKSESSVEVTPFVAHWMARVYVTMQWEYSIPSKEISKQIPASVLKESYELHCGNSLQGTCKRLYEEYFSKNQERNEEGLSIEQN